jgi:putative oxidoreductase
MNLFDTTPSRRQLGVGLLVLRLALGAVFLVHGGQKLMMGPGAMAGMFANMGAPAPSLTGPLAMVVEPLAGAALVLGVLTRLAALGVAVDMLGALLIVHVGNGFFVPRGIEFPMMLFASAVALMLVGAGPFSLDRTIARRRLVR